MASSNTNRIARNTLFLYIRMVILMVINLYTVRVVLNALGVEDYGTFNVVAGVVTMFASVSSIISTATQRFISYSLGKKNDKEANDFFIASLNLFLFASMIIFVLAETIGLWLVNTQLVIPIDRLYAANWVYQLSIITFIITIVQTPYISVLIAHEDIDIFSILTVIDYVLKLLLAFSIYVVPLDSLIWYASSLLLAQIFLLIAYIVICDRKYKECKYYFKRIAKVVYQKLLFFSGWTMISSFASIGMYQLTTILINIFFGPIVTASRAISLQVNSALFSLSNNFLTAVKSPMIRSYAEKNYNYLYKIFNTSNKFILYCLLIIGIPLIVEMDFVLDIWLGKSDETTVIFSQLIVVYAILMTLNNPVSIIIQAVGDLKRYVLTTEFFTIACVPITYICFKVGMSHVVAYYIMIICTVAAHIARLIILKKKFPLFCYREYVWKFITPSFFIGIISFAIVMSIHDIIDNGYYRLLFVGAASCFSVVMLSYLIGLNKDEKLLIKSCVNKTIRK